MSDDQCDRCGGTFLVELTVVAENPPGIDRDRIEAELCYSCRRDVTHESLA